MCWNNSSVVISGFSLTKEHPGIKRLTSNRKQDHAETILFIIMARKLGGKDR
jgi:hypothetical protein